MPLREGTDARLALMARQGAAIMAARRAAGLSRASAAASFGVSVAAVIAWEQGCRACPLAHRRRMVAEWGADPAALETADDHCPHCGRPYELVAHSTRRKPKGKRR